MNMIQAKEKIVLEISKEARRNPKEIATPSVTYVLHKVQSTTPTFNSCTKCVGIPGIMNDRMSDCYSFALAWMYR